MRQDSAASRVHFLLVIAIALSLVGVSCSDESPPRRGSQARPVPPSPSEASPQDSVTPEDDPDEEVASLEPVNRWVTRRPQWLGKRVLPRGPNGFGLVKPTPRLLRNRRLATIDRFPRPRVRKFRASIGPIPRSVLERSTWRPRCPVGIDDLAYIKMTFWGFDHRAHTGEMIVNASVAEQVAGVFRLLYRARFPIEEMRVVTLREQREWRTRSTGDTNVTSSFECRKATLGSSWSEHAYGLAIDINPFHNPYTRGELVAPELAGVYVNRSRQRPGMILEGGAVTDAFDAIGWGWGGRWSSTKDWMHFSRSGH